MIGTKDEWKLTAYALGELDEADRAEVEAALAADEAARREVEAIRATAAALSAELAAEAPAEAPAAGLDPARREAVLAGPVVALAPRRRARWGAAAGVAALAAAAALALTVVPMGREAADAPGVPSAARPAEAPPVLAQREQAEEGGERPAEVTAEAPQAEGERAAPAPATPAASPEGAVAAADPASGLEAPAKREPMMLKKVPGANPFERVRDTRHGSGGLGLRGGGVGGGGLGTGSVGGLGRLDAGGGRGYGGPGPGGRATRGNGGLLLDGSRVEPPPVDREAYDHLADNAFRSVADEPLSTFSIDVDTASYANVRRFLQSGVLPPPDAVRIEELVNYFPYRYEGPTDGRAPFAANLEVGPAPWAPSHRLVRIGLKGYDVPMDDRPRANLVFLIDVSGSMQPANKLPLLREAMKMLVAQLQPDDTVAIVVYAGAAGMVLAPTPAADRPRITDAIDRLESGGSTNGGAGIELAYRLARDHLVEGGVNRVILATDGDFNVGTTHRGGLVRMVQREAKSGVFLTVLGFGMGNLQDAMLEEISNKGNGAYAYIDSEREARKTLVEQVAGTLVTIAKDVKIQVEMNPARVASYRLIGYENRLLAARDFNDDKKDAGEIGSGHTVTALYEIVPAGDPSGAPAVDPLKYQPPAPAARPAAPASAELLTVKVRYKQPDGDTSTKLEFPLVDRGTDLADTSDDFRLAAGVAAFGMLLRDSPHKAATTWSLAADLIGSATAWDPNGYRTELAALVETARRLAQ